MEGVVVVLKFSPIPPIRIPILSLASLSLRPLIFVDQAQHSSRSIICYGIPSVCLLIPHVNQAPNYSPNAKDNWTVVFGASPWTRPKPFQYNIRASSAARQLWQPPNFEDIQLNQRENGKGNGKKSSIFGIWLSANIFSLNVFFWGNIIILYDEFNKDLVHFIKI